MPLPSEVNRPKVAEFLVVTFGISWTSAALIYASGIEYGTLMSTALVVPLFMWAPGIAAVFVQLRHGESVRAGCGLFRGRLRWVAFAWLAPVALLALTIGVGAALPSVSFSIDYAGFLAESGITDEQIKETVSVLESLPVPVVVFFIVQGLLAGLSINALAALGEELGWRGLLLSELAPLGFWRLSALTGFVWGIWHTPIILQGHNFPNSPLVGVAVMTVWTVLASPVFTYLTVRARSVLAATFFHGSFNALAGLSVLYLVGGGRLLVSPVGAAGIGATVIAVAACVVHDRYVAAEPVTSVDAPLSQWEKEIGQRV